MLINPLLETLYTEQILSTSPPRFILFLCAPGRTFSHAVYAAVLLFLVVYSGGGGWKWSRVVLIFFFFFRACIWNQTPHQSAFSKSGGGCAGHQVAGNYKAMDP